MKAEGRLGENWEPSEDDDDLNADSGVGEVKKMQARQSRVAKAKGANLKNLRYTEQELDAQAFTKLLGLPKVTLAQLFHQYKDNDDVVQDIMAE